MEYGGQSASTQAPQTQSLLSDSTHIVDRLQSLHNNLIDLGNRLHGSQPRDVAGAGNAKIEPEPTLRRNLDKAGSWLSDIENELQRISARV